MTVVAPIQKLRIRSTQETVQYNGRQINFVLKRTSRRTLAISVLPVWPHGRSGSGSSNESLPYCPQHCQRAPTIAAATVGGTSVASTCCGRSATAPRSVFPFGSRGIGWSFVQRRRLIPRSPAQRSTTGISARRGGCSERSSKTARRGSRRSGSKAPALHCGAWKGDSVVVRLLANYCLTHGWWKHQLRSLSS